MRAEQDLARDALGRVAVGLRHERVVELQRGERASRRSTTSPLSRSCLLDRLPLRDVLGREELGDGVTLVHRDEREHGLAAEEVLVGDVVLVDLVALVEVAVLAGRELEVA